MSSLLIAAILSFCPGHDTDSKGQIITTQCQERMLNCMINRAGTSEPSKKDFEKCSNELRNEYRSSSTVVSSSIK